MSYHDKAADLMKFLITSGGPVSVDEIQDEVDIRTRQQIYLWMRALEGVGLVEERKSGGFTRKLEWRWIGSRGMQI